MPCPPGRRMRASIRPNRNAKRSRVLIRADVKLLPLDDSSRAVMTSSPLSSMALSVRYHCNSLLPQPGIPYWLPSPLSKNQVSGSSCAASNSSLHTSVNASPGETAELSATVRVGLSMLTLTADGGGGGLTMAGESALPPPPHAARPERLTAKNRPAHRMFADEPVIVRLYSS